MCSVQVNVDLDKYENLPVKSWIPALRQKGNRTFYTGVTGCQFWCWNKNCLEEFYNVIKKKTIINPIANGIGDFYGASDTNLTEFIYYQENKWLWAITDKKLDHIGWEKYLNENNELDQTCDYCIEKAKNVAYIRSNEPLKLNKDINIKLL